MDKTTELFCLINDFCQQFEPLLEQRLLGDSSDKQRHTAEQAAGLHVAVRDDHDCGAVSHHARAVVQGVLLGNRLPFHDLGVFPPAVIYPLRGPDAALCGGAGGLVRRTQGRLHGHFHCPTQRHWPFVTICASNYGFKLHAVINHRGELLSRNSRSTAGLSGFASNHFGQCLSQQVSSCAVRRSAKPAAAISAQLARTSRVLGGPADDMLSDRLRRQQRVEAEHPGLVKWRL